MWLLRSFACAHPRNAGIYKSIDGGENWERIHFVNELTGCSELSMDMSNPEVLYAAMWEHQRKPWKVISGGGSSGLYKTTEWSKPGKRSTKVCQKRKEKWPLRSPVPIPKSLCID